MGYTTNFTGKFQLDRPLAPQHAAYLRMFSETRRMARDPAIAATLPDPIREAARLPIGPHGTYFVGGNGDFGQEYDPSVLNNNHPPGLPGWNVSGESYEDHRKACEAAVAAGAQPGLWCQWVPSEDGTAIEWDEGENFYEYTLWLRYLIENFLRPWGYVLNGKVRFQGEDSDDRGAVIVEDNNVTHKEDTIIPA